MITFKDKSKNEILSAFSLEEIGDKIIVQFKENGKKYSYKKENIELFDTNDNLKLSFTVYKLPKKCYKCGKITEILTYIIFDDGTNEDVQYPWDIERLTKERSFSNVYLHSIDPSIEYYALQVVGDNDDFDQLMLKKYPNRIQTKYSETKKRAYAMNICQHCGNGQGQNYVYRDVNLTITSRKKIDIK